ncbi:hypothetical protein [Halpernia frigidisoli]|uniref:Uncharacterized protein n=1 Tax=Halpernia frigidisoli TaxID=1125876 RepID=A0A1I3IL51_9FLAO|nr:hypothetical protein [Halpernia frigidisoli]SFI48642.1 hypothetical protein SAMN05443292_2673 [Halpernia frigidisoli]
MKKLKFYLIGLVPGILFVLFIFGKKDASCSYFPSARVKAETLTEIFKYSPDFKQETDAQKITEKFLRDSIFENGKIDFDRSNAQEKPFPKYLIMYPAKNPKFEIEFQKAKDTATFMSLKTLR